MEGIKRMLVSGPFCCFLLLFSLQINEWVTVVFRPVKCCRRERRGRWGADRLIFSGFSDSSDPLLFPFSSFSVSWESLLPINKRHDSSPLLVKPPPGPRTRPPTLNKIQPSYRGCASPRPNPHLTGEGLAGAQMLTTFQQLTAFQPSAFQQLPKPRAPLGAGQEQDWPYSARGLKNNPLASRKCRKCLSPVS